MDPVIGGALIQAGSGILGSLFGKKGLSPSQVIESNAIGYRHFGEMYGFNPLTLMGANMVQPGQAPPNYLGEAISDAGMMLADAYAKRTDAQKVSRLEERNRKLQEKVQSLTLRPKVGGVYAQTERTPTSAKALGVSYGSAGQAVVARNAGSVRDGSSSGDVRPLIDTDQGSIISDPRRDVENSPVKTHSGSIIVDNPNLPVPIRIPTIDGDEALQWYDYPSLIAPGVVAGIDFLRSPAFGPPDGYASDGMLLAEPKVSKFSRPKVPPDGMYKPPPKPKPRPKRDNSPAKKMADWMRYGDWRQSF